MKQTSTLPYISRLACILGCLSCIAAVLYVLGPMAVSSLWNDELYTVMEFSSKGPLHVVSDYHVPNNHIFFNLLNSILPDSSSVAPLRARFLSLLAISLCLILASREILKERRLWTGALIFILFAQPGFLELCMQARGYGFLALFALLQCILLYHWAQAPNHSLLWGIALITVFGTWTVPSYLFFAAPLQLCIFAFFRNRTTFLTGCAAALAVGIVYAPVATELAHASASYRDEHGAHFTGIVSCLVLARDYLHIESASYQLFLIAIIGAGVFAIPRNERPPYAIILLSICCALLIVLILQTPLARTIAFLLVPATFLTGLTLQAASKYLIPEVLSVALFVCFSFFCLYKSMSFPEYIPIENWKRVARFLELQFPEDIQVYAPFRFHQLAMYASKDLSRASTFAPELFLSGTLIAVENKYAKQDFPDITGRFPDARSQIIRQQRGGAQIIYWIDAEKSRLVDRETE